MTAQEQHTLSSVIYMAQQLGRMPCLRDAMAVLDEDNLKHSGAQASTKSPAPAPGASTSLTPGPMELARLRVPRASSVRDAKAMATGPPHAQPPVTGSPATQWPPAHRANISKEEEETRMAEVAARRQKWP